MVRLRQAALAALFGAPLIATLASAHVGHVIARAERYLKLDVAGSDARFVVSLNLGPEEGQRVLQSADQNGDGTVDALEQSAYLGEWGRGLIRELPVEVDGEPQRVVWGDGYFEPIGQVRPVALTVEMVARFALEGGEASIAVTDAMVRREVFDRTDVSFQVRDGATLVASAVGEAPQEPLPDLAYGPDFQPGRTPRLVAVVRTPAQGLSDATTAAVAAVVVLFALFGLVVGLRRVVGRRRDGVPPTGGTGS